MTTPRKRPGDVAATHLRNADAALADADTAFKQTRQKRSEIARILAEIDHQDVIKRYPERVARAVILVQKMEADIAVLEADARASHEAARRCIIAGIYAHREEA